MFRQAAEIEAVARDWRAPWPARRLAALVLETLLSRIKGDKERRFWVERFGLTDSAELAREGYTADEPLTRQVWRRLARNRRIHRLAWRRDERSFADFLAAAEQECRLTFARYLFTADEIIARIEQNVRRSLGEADRSIGGNFEAESAHARNALPAMERAIVESLAKDGLIRWASPRTPQTINSLIEQPRGTVVVTIKPPGSDHEIEIKRAGRPRPRPLDVVWRRDGCVLPSSHHLDGGSMSKTLRDEAENAAFLSRIFRRVHGDDAPISRTLSLSRVVEVPSPDGNVPLAEYFATRRLTSLRKVAGLLAKQEQEPEPPPGATIETLAAGFLAHTEPGQAILLDNTSFRLDVVERYLRPNGMAHYFGKSTHTSDHCRRFADSILDEILGDYEPPRVVWRSHRQYVDAAFRVSANRERAQRIYRSLLAQAGRFWGTLLALRGSTNGESFVARNVGLRSVWRAGAWQVRIIFMDHDGLGFDSVCTDTFRPAPWIGRLVHDGLYFFGGSFRRQRVRGALSYLRAIYRPTMAVHTRAMDGFRGAMRHAYDKTHEAMLTSPEVMCFFEEPFRATLRNWDELAASFLRNRTTRAAWRTASRERLTIRGYAPEVAEEYVATVTKHARFLRRLAFLF